MNILFLAPRLPLPADTGGKIRTYNILKQLAKENHVHLMCFSFEEADKSYLLEFHALGIEVTLIPMPELSLFKKIPMVFFSPIPFSIAKYKSPAMAQAIAALVKKQKFDAVHVDHLHMAHYEEYFQKIPMYLDEHNVEYKILERCASVETKVIKKYIYVDQTYKMRSIEAQKAKQFKGIFACSLDDQLLLSKLTVGLVPTHVIPNGVDTDFFNSPIQLDEEPSLVFTGSMDWLPNDDGITYFCKEILPLVWKENPRVKLYVVGKSPSKAVVQLAAEDKRVIVTGRVDDVRPYIQKSHVFIVPLRIGGGTRLKILEAMAMRKAIVSTTIGAEGIEYEKNVHMSLGDLPHLFAKSILDLLNDKQRMIAMGEKGRTLVCEKYDWHITGKKINAVYHL